MLDGATYVTASDRAARAGEWGDRAGEYSRAIERADADGCDARFAWGDLLVEIAAATGNGADALDFAVENDVRANRARQWMWVARAWPEAERFYSRWSHYRATAGVADRSARHRLMARAEQEGWTEDELKAEVRKVNAAAGAGESSTPNGAPPDPAAYDTWTGYFLARLVDDGMSERRAADIAALAARAEHEWKGCHDGVVVFIPAARAQTVAGGEL